MNDLFVSYDVTLHFERSSLPPSVFAFCTIHSIDVIDYLKLYLYISFYLSSISFDKFEIILSQFIKSNF